MADRVVWDAATYDAPAQSVQGAWGRKLIASYPWRGDEHVLDAGCGTGTLAAALLEQFPDLRVTAVDADASMIAAAKKALAPFGDRVAIIQADLTQLPDGLPDVDVVFSNAVFHWIHDHPTLFRSLHNALVPEGQLVAQCGGAGNLRNTRAAVQRIIEAAPWSAAFDDWQPPWHYADAKATQTHLEAAGFKDVQAWLTPAPTPFESRNAFQAFVTGTTLRPYRPRVPEAAWESFVDDVMAEAKGPPWELDYVRLDVRAIRSPLPAIRKEWKNI